MSVLLGLTVCLVSQIARIAPRERLAAEGRPSVRNVRAEDRASLGRGIVLSALMVQGLLTWTLVCHASLEHGARPRRWGASIVRLVRGARATLRIANLACLAVRATQVPPCAMIAKKGIGAAVDSRCALPAKMVHGVAPVSLVAFPARQAIA